MSGDISCLALLQDVVTGYGKKKVIGGVSLELSPGEIVALIGHNGAGKSTLLKAMFGLLPVWSGKITIDGLREGELSPHLLLKVGIAYVPQGNRVFGELTVGENLEVAATNAGESPQATFNTFPALQPLLRRVAGTLSGGEKQMVALAQALAASPRLLLLDEPSLGLAPQAASAALQHVSRLAREREISLLIVEQKVRQILRIAHRVYVLRNGQVSYSGRAEALAGDDQLLRQVYL